MSNYDDTIPNTPLSLDEWSEKYIKKYRITGKALEKFGGKTRRKYRKRRKSRKPLKRLFSTFS